MNHRWRQPPKKAFATSSATYQQTTPQLPWRPIWQPSGLFTSASALLTHCKEHHVSIWCSGAQAAKRVHARLQRLPVTAQLMRHLKQALPGHVLSVHYQHMLWAAYCLAFFGFMRIGELLGTQADTGAPLLTASNVSLAPGWLTVRVRQGKTDPFRRGCQLHIGELGSFMCDWRVGVFRVCPYGRSNATLQPGRSSVLPLHTCSSTSRGTPGLVATSPVYSKLASPTLGLTPNATPRTVSG